LNNSKIIKKIRYKWYKLFKYVFLFQQHPPFFSFFFPFLSFSILIFFSVSSLLEVLLLSLLDGLINLFPILSKSSSIPVDSFAEVLWKVASSSFANFFPSSSRTSSSSYKSFLFAATASTIIIKFNIYIKIINYLNLENRLI